MPETLYLIDAYAQIFRAYYAIRGGMRSPVTGEPTHAVFGFADLQIRIVSKDKDLEQLLGERVAMFDIHTDTTLDVNWLKEAKGITPEQVVDVLALMGDTVDNVPGVEGIGPKTAAQLVQEF